MNEKIIERLHGKWDELKSEAKKDCISINKEDMREDFNLSGLRMKWLNTQQDWLKAYFNIEMKRKQLQRELIEYYKYDYNGSFDGKDQFNLFVETDSRYVSILQQTQIMKAIIDYCENVGKRLDNKGWEIKNFLEYQRFMAGL